ncbi:PAS domain S-box protein [Algibacter amylolyticus]|uniref:histidine kinase n=1 Tax=Algibacter amylolyticus TaxID=1608400 RepID=A0A5M7BIA7_9FLAO|nr:PAS domain S-box protein [Algibacter amylolyticus]KAA5827998.1 PAS domain S-box protein [Algibacter amylolyticus]MBB5267240.1 PAS domain S-box-containing protein [Algibacter amylolyticus]TSJ82243.1 PAS domain S-box protein [Algibacter amylolyticus]
MNIYATILVEFLLIASSILFLFKLRAKIGLAPLYLLLGAVQYLQANAVTSFSITIFDGYVMYPGSIILFSVLLFAVLLIYIKEGVASTRALIIGIIISNIIMALVFQITYVQQYLVSQINNASINSSSILVINFKYFSKGTAIMSVDFLLLIILYQYLISRLKKLPFFLVLFSSLFLILMFDAIVYNIAMHYGTPLFKSSLICHLIGKAISSVVFSLLLYVYLKYFDNESGGASFIANRERDIFSIIDYRKKYKDLVVEKQKVEQELSSQIEVTLNNISDGFISLDKKWCYTYVNKKAGEILGRTPSNLLGKHIWTEFPEGIGLPFYDAYYKAEETQQAQIFQGYYTPLDKWFENKIYPTSEGLTIYFTDITERKKSEELLNESERNLDNIINNIGDPLFVKDNESRMVMVNQAFCKMFNLSVDQIIGKTLAEDVSPEERKNFLKIDREVLETGIENENEETITLQGKEKQIISTKKTRYIDGNGNKFLIGTIRDITENKKAEENNKMLLSLIETSDDFIGLASLEGKPIYLNKKGRQLVELGAKQELPNHITDFYPKRLHDVIVHDHITSVYKTENWRGESEFKTFKTGNLIPVEMSGFLINDSNSKPMALGIVASNITVRKRAEAELNAHKNNLEELVSSRTSELEKEKVKAQSADLMKSAFLATMSHELRTPMNSIIGFTGILLKEIAGPLNREQIKQLQMVKNSGDHLLSLINDVLDISKIEAGKLEVTFAPFDYLKSLQSSIDFVSPQASAKALNLKTEISEMEITLVSDQGRVEQVLLNLLSNAIKFSEQGTILIKADVVDNHLITQVIDQGIGISEKDISKLFMPFAQLKDGLNRNHEGTGLGLSICKNLIEKLGGSINVQSEIGKGSNFSFKLPLGNLNKK